MPVRRHVCVSIRRRHQQRQSSAEPTALRVPVRSGDPPGAEIARPPGRLRSAGRETRTPPRRPGRRRWRRRTPRAGRSGTGRRSAAGRTAGRSRACALAAERWPGHCGPDQLLDRVVAQEGGEEDRDGRQSAHVLGDRSRARRAPPGRWPSSWQRRGESPAIIRLKKMPMDSTWAEFWKVGSCRRPRRGAPAAGCSSRRRGWARRRRPWRAR